MTKYVENTIPIIGVSDLKKSIDFYTTTLGFNLDWEDTSLCSVSRDGHSIMISSRQSDNNNNSWIWLGLYNDLLIEELSTKDINIVEPPTNRPWAFDMQIQDPDGNTLWLAAPSKTTQTGPEK